MNHFCAIDRREGTVAGCGPSNLAARAGDEAGLALKHLPQQADRVRPERTNLGRRVTE